MKTRKTEQNARENYKKVYFLMIVVSTILFWTAIGCQKKVDTSLKAQSSIVEYTCISDSDSDTFFDLLARYGVLAFLYEVIMTGFQHFDIVHAF